MAVKRRKITLTDAQKVKADTQADVITCSECERAATAYDVVRHGRSKRGVCLSCGGKYDDGSCNKELRRLPSPRPLLPWESCWA